jgi:phosphoglycerol transferase MdoB-like AlkP superfamily enzyme
MEKPSLNNRVLDKLGVWVSAMCALHCILLPVLLPALPLLASSFVAQEWFERSILTISIAIGFAALLIGFKQYHRQLYPLYSLSLGAVIYWNKHMFGEAYEPITITVGAAFIIAAHLINLKLCRQCKSC